QSSARPGVWSYTWPPAITRPASLSTTRARSNAGRAPSWWHQRRTPRLRASTQRRRGAFKRTGAASCALLAGPRPQREASDDLERTGALDGASWTGYLGWIQARRCLARGVGERHRRI